MTEMTGAMRTPAHAADTRSVPSRQPRFLVFHWGGAASMGAGDGMTRGAGGSALFMAGAEEGEGKRRGRGRYSEG
jgi:hypothetical protein